MDSFLSQINHYSWLIDLSISFSLFLWSYYLLLFFLAFHLLFGFLFTFRFILFYRNFLITIIILHLLYLLRYLYDYGNCFCWHFLVVRVKSEGRSQDTPHGPRGDTRTLTHDPIEENNFMWMVIKWSNSCCQPSVYRRSPLITLSPLYLWGVLTRGIAAPSGPLRVGQHPP